MRKLLLTVVASLIALAPTTARADDKDTDAARKVIEKSIKATGGEDKLAKQKCQTFKMKGKFYGMGEGIDYSASASVQAPDKYRLALDFAVMDMKFNLVQIINGDKVWSKLNDMLTEGDKDAVAESKEEMHAHHVMSLVPLLKDKGFTLSVVGDAEVNKKKGVTVRVQHKGRRDINLTFDKETGLLLKSERTVKDQMMGGKEFAQEDIYEEYKDVDGMKMATKVVINRDGKLFVDAEMSDFEMKDKLDDKLFEKP